MTRPWARIGSIAYAIFALVSGVLGGVVNYFYIMKPLFNQSTTVNCAEVSKADQNDIDSTPGNGNMLGEDDDDCTPEEPEIDLECDGCKTIRAVKDRSLVEVN